MLIRVLGDPGTLRALRLAGLDGRAVGASEDARAAGAAFDEMLSEQDLGILLVTEPVAQQIRQRVDAAKLSRHFPLVLEIPARGVPGEPVDDLVARVARQVGIAR